MLYKEASKIVDLVQKKQGTIKSLVHSSGSKNIKQLYALVCETLKYSGIIEQILVNARFLEHEKWLERPLAKVLTYEFLFGKGIQCGGKYRQAFKRHKSSLNAALVRMKIKMGVVRNKDLLPKSLQDEVFLPRYVRVNTLKSTEQDVIKQFLSEGYECILTREQAATETKPGRSADEIRLHKDYVKSLKPLQFICDVHLPDLLVFPPATDFHAHQLYRTGVIILQDKASCLPAHVLAPPPGSHVIDACAAPGNKTSQLAAILKNTGKVFAFDVDRKRVSTMSKLTGRSGATNLEIHTKDFLTVDPRSQTFANVRHILLDPSCSGSGIVSRLDHLTNDSQSDSKERLEALAKIQIKLLLHAMSFPRAERVVYSTCSVHRTENENVVLEALATNPGFELEHALPMWQNRGVGIQEDDVSSESTPDDSPLCIKACLRAIPKEDCTNGFFVALFKRRHSPPNHEQSSVNLEVETKTNCKRKKRNRKGQAKQDHETSDKAAEGDSVGCNGEQARPSPVAATKTRKRKRRRKGAELHEHQAKILKTDDAITRREIPLKTEESGSTNDQNVGTPNKRKQRKKRRQSTGKNTS